MHNEEVKTRQLVDITNSQQVISQSKQNPLNKNVVLERLQEKNLSLPTEMENPEVKPKHLSSKLIILATF